MKIAFWSNTPGQAGTTSNLLAVSLYISLKYKFNSILTQTAFRGNNMETPLIGVSSRNTDLFQDVGIDSLMREIKAAALTKTDFHNCSVSVIKGLNLITSTSKENEDHYKVDVDKTFENIIHYAESFFDIVFIDTLAGKNDVTNKVLEEADLIVINLSQNKTMLDEFFKNTSLDLNKAFFIIGNYDKNSTQNIANLTRRYKKINGMNSAVIPHDTDFLDAQSAGTLVDFMKRNIKADKDDNNYDFMNGVTSAANKILKKIGIKEEAENDAI